MYFNSTRIYLTFGPRKGERCLISKFDKKYRQIVWFVKSVKDFWCQYFQTYDNWNLWKSISCWHVIDLIHWINFIALIICCEGVIHHLQYHNHSNSIFLREYPPYAVPNHGDEVATLILELKMASKVSITMVNTRHCMASRVLIILIE